MILQRTWASNSTQLQHLAKQDGSTERSNNVKILGLQWNTSSDMLSLASRNIKNVPPFITQRDILQDSSRIFDPLGLITPVTIQAYRNCGENTYNVMNHSMMILSTSGG